MERRLLIVDDEPAIRSTLAAIFEAEGFQAITAATVRSALEALSTSRFDALISDLNIGSPGDGFTVVSAMRRTQPEAVTFIITGYPDFESALEAIRSQVDGYITKPANVQALVQQVKDKLNSRTAIHKTGPVMRIGDLIEQNAGLIIRKWLDKTEESSELNIVPLSREQRMEHVSSQLSEVVHALRSSDLPRADSLPSASIRGSGRKRLGYTIPMLIEENRLLEQTLFEVVEANLMGVELSFLMRDLIHIIDVGQVQLRTMIVAFLEEDTGGDLEQRRAS